jgi:hypothetical protein
MSILSQQFKLPPEQQFGTYTIKFPIEDVETSIPARFEKMVRLFSRHRVALRFLNQL